MKTIWILGDQLSLEHAALAGAKPGEARVLMIESKARGAVHRFHQIKLVLVYSAMRHFARDLRAEGWEVDYVHLEQGFTFEKGLRHHLTRHRPDKILLAEPNSFFETEAIERLGRKLKVAVELRPTTQFLVPRADFHQWARGSRRLLMENHYRRLRKQFGWLMKEDGQPVGGAWNFDPENRATFATWKRAGRPHAATAPREEPDEITRDVMEMVAREFPEHPGPAEDMWLPVDRAGALRWPRAFHPRAAAHLRYLRGHDVGRGAVPLPLGPLAAAQSRPAYPARVRGGGDRGLRARRRADQFRGRVCPPDHRLARIHQWRLLAPRAGVRPAQRARRHARPPGVVLHRRDTAELPPPRRAPDAGARVESPYPAAHDSGQLLPHRPHPPAGGAALVFRMYVDAFDWVMAANVLGMSLYADGGYMATKPYAASSGYIRKMSNYCAGCRFNPDEKTGPNACPYNYLYWHFIDQHAARFADNPRMRALVQGWLKRSAADQARVRESARVFLEEHVG